MHISAALYPSNRDVKVTLGVSLVSVSAATKGQSRREACAFRGSINACVCVLSMHETLYLAAQEVTQSEIHESIDVRSPILVLAWMRYEEPKHRKTAQLGGDGGPDRIRTERCKRRRPFGFTARPGTTVATTTRH